MNYWSLLDKYLGEDKKKKDAKLNIVVLNPPTSTMYTGAGADGVVQPNRPVATDFSTNPPSVYHEDEVVRKGADGQLLQVQPSPMTIARTAQEQAAMDAQQKRLGLPGYAEGFNFSSPLLNRSAEVKNKVSALFDQPETRTAVGTPVTGPATQTPTFNIQPDTRTTVGAPVTGPATQTPMFDTTNVSATDITQPIPYVKPPAAWESGAQEGYAGLRDVARGQSEASRLAGERAMDYLAGTSAGQLGSSQQQWLSAGVSPETMAALTTQAQRSQDITRGGVMKDLAIAEAERAEGAQKDLITQGNVLQTMEENKYKFETLVRTTEGSALAARLQELHDAGIDWTDPSVVDEIRGLAQKAWEANGNTGTVSDDWIGTQSTTANVNQIDVWVNDLLSSEAYASLGADEQAAIKEAIPYLAIATQVGATWGVEDGKFVIYNAEGKVVYRQGEGVVNNAGKGLTLGATNLPTNMLDGLRYVTDNTDPENPIYGQFVNGDTFTLENNATIGDLGYTLPAGEYTVEVDNEGNVWYHGRDNKYYLSSANADIISTIKNDSDYLKTITDGMDNTDLSFVNTQKPLALNTDLKVGDVSYLPRNIEWNYEGVNEYGTNIISYSKDGLSYQIASSNNNVPANYLAVEAIKGKSALFKDVKGKLWFASVLGDGSFTTLMDVNDLDEQKRKTIYEYLNYKV